MIPDIGNRADGGLSTPALKAVVFPMGGYLIQHAEIRGKQQRAVVQQPPLYHPLGAAGNFQITNGYVTGPVFPGWNADGIQRRDHQGKHSVVVHSAVGADDVRVIHIAQIVIDCPAADDPAHHGDSPLPQGLRMDLPADILVAAYHDSWGVFPEQEHIVVPKRLVYIFFESLIIEGVIGNIPHSQHIWSPAFCLLHIKFFHITGKAESKRFPLFLFEKGYMVN